MSIFDHGLNSLSQLDEVLLDGERDMPSIDSRPGAEQSGNRQSEGSYKDQSSRRPGEDPHPVGQCQQGREPDQDQTEANKRLPEKHAPQLPSRGFQVVQQTRVLAWIDGPEVLIRTILSRTGLTHGVIHQGIRSGIGSVGHESFGDEHGEQAEENPGPELILALAARRQILQVGIEGALA
jgi:hypothetical protein